MSDIEKLTLIVLIALTCPLALPIVIDKVEDEKPTIDTPTIDTPTMRSGHENRK